MQVLGDRAQEVMTEHYETWVTEDDIEQLHQAGMNHLRIPVGEYFFFFLSPLSLEITCLGREDLAGLPCNGHLSLVPRGVVAKTYSQPTH